MNAPARWLGVLLLGYIGSVNAADWKMEAADSRLEFVAVYERDAAPGVFKKFDTRLRFDPDRLGASKLQVTVTVTSADMSSAEVNEAIRAPEWFDFARFAEAEFRSSEIRRTAQGLYVARGKLTLKGITQEMAVPFSWTASGNTAALEGETTLKRSAFGIGTGEWENGDVIGLDVKVKYKIKLRKAS